MLHTATIKIGKKLQFTKIVFPIPGQSPGGSYEVLEAVAGPGHGVPALVLCHQNIPRALGRGLAQGEGSLVADGAGVHDH